MSARRYLTIVQDPRGYRTPGEQVLIASGNRACREGETTMMQRSHRVIETRRTAGSLSTGRGGECHVPGCEAER